jgi:predicted Fe-Mo cluster-binding NifX family protein
MRIAIPSDDGVHIASHTGRTRGFVIYDIEDSQVRKVEYRENRYTAHARGEHENHAEHTGRHHSHAPLMGALSDCEALIAHGMGPRLIRDLESKNIQVTFCTEMDVEEAVSQYAAGRLETTDKSTCNHQ